MANLSSNEIIYLILIGSSGMLLLIGGIAVFIAVYQRKMLAVREYQRKSEEEHQQNMIQLQFESQEIERRRIASDLHDSVGSLLWGAKLTAAYIERLYGSDEVHIAAHKELMEILDQSIHTVKRIAWELAPESFNYSGLSVALASLCSRLDGKGLNVQYREEGNTILWNDGRALQVYRIAQELLSNGIRHAQANNISVALTWTALQILLEIADDGKGFKLESKRTGIGWWNINQRVSQLQANIEIGVPPIGKGTMVILTVPLLNE